MRLAPLPETDIPFDDLMAPFGLSPDVPLAVAVSGGPDSMALLLLAADEARRSGRSLHALTVDHGLRAEAGTEALQVGGWARALGVAHTVLTHSGDTPRASVQAAARSIRYRLMAEWCATHNMAALLVAHTREDQAETFLLRLARGSGVDGLSAMAADTRRNDMRILRPLLDVPRDALHAVLATAGQAYITDPSNADARHARVRMRALAPVLEAEGLTAQRLADTAARMMTAREALDGWTSAHLARAVTFHKCGYGTADLAALLDAPDEIRLRAASKLIMAITGNAYPPRLHHTRALVVRLGDASFNGATLGGARLVRRGDTLMVFREARAIAPAVRRARHLPLLWDGRFEVGTHDMAPNKAPVADVTIAPLGQKGWRWMRDVAPDTALPAAAAACLPAVFDGGTLLEVPSLGLTAGGDVASLTARFVGPQRVGLAAAV